MQPEQNFEIKVKPVPAAETQPEEVDDLGRMFRIFLLATAIGAMAAYVASELHDPSSDDTMIRIRGGMVSAESFVIGLLGAAIGMPTGAIVVGLVLGDPGRGVLIGAFACFLGAAMGAGCEDAMPAIVIGGLGAGFWCAMRLSD